MQSQSSDLRSDYAFILSAQHHSEIYQPANDQVWEFVYNKEDQNPFRLQTTYNLRAQSMRILPSVRLVDSTLTHPEGFFQPPTITQYTPAYLRVQYQPIHGLQIELNCFAAAQDILVGAIKVTNQTDEKINFIAEIAAILIPMNGGTPTRPLKVDGLQVLTGQSEDLHPVLYMTGGAHGTNNPLPALINRIASEPQHPQQISWACVTQNTQKKSLKTAQRILESPWRETAQNAIMAHASQHIQIKTGDPDWDAAFELSQIAAASHFITSPDPSSPHFVRTRLPDQSLPSEAKSTVDDLTILEAAFLAQAILPGQEKALSAMLEKFIRRIDKQGQLNIIRNQSPFMPPIRECPLLASLCLDLYEINQDQTFLARVFPALCQNFISWGISHQPDAPAYTWDDPQQLQLDTGGFNFDRWDKTGRGLNIRTAESPALAAMLYRETLALQKISDITGIKCDDLRLEKFSISIKKKLNAFWHDEEYGFAYLDHETHQSPAKELNYAAPAQGLHEIYKTFSEPHRLQCHLFAGDEHTRAASLHLTGLNANGHEITETYKPADIRWVDGRAHLTTEHIYSALHRAEIIGLKSDDQVELETADYTQSDITCLLPLLTGTLTKAQIQWILNHPLNIQDTERYYGIPETWRCQADLPDGLPIRINVLWNTLIIKSLADQGDHDEAMHLFSHLIATIIDGIKDFNGFYPYYNAKNGKPAGQRNAITGMLPLRLFLQIAGIRLFSPSRIALWGTNPFPWPININWQGLSIKRGQTTTRVVFPNGSTYEHTSDKPVLLTAGSERQ